MGGVESTKVTAGLAGFVVLFCLAIACWLLFRSMNKHLRKVRWQQEQEEEAARQQEAEAHGAARRAEGGSAGRAEGSADAPEAADTDDAGTGDVGAEQSDSGEAGGPIDRE